MRSILALLSLTAASPACTFSKPEANSTTGTGTGETEQSGTMNGSSSTDGTTDSSTQTAVTDESATETTETTELETESTMGTETTDTAGTDTSDTTGPRCPDVCGLDGLSCDEACELSFADVPQWYCTGSCSPVGEMVGFLNCDQSDADLFCQLLTGDPASTATEWQQGVVIDAPGFCCALQPDVQVDLGPLPEFGIEALCYQGTTMIENFEFHYALLATDLECD